MVTAADFIHNAGNEPNILNMFKNNIIMITYAESQNNAGVHNMNVTPGWGIKNYAGKKVDGTPIPVFSVNNKVAVGATFPSYWCPYKGNDAKHAYLGNGASYMFTAKMDGCTFAVGSQITGTAGVFVTHANLGGKGVEQHNLIASKVQFRNDLGTKMLNPSMYKFGGGAEDGPWTTQATTFGILIGSQWKFFSQVVRIATQADTITLLGVVPFA